MAEKQRAFLLRWGYRAAVAALIWLAVRYLLPWLLPFLPALAAATLLEPLVERVRRRTRIKRNFLAAVITLAALAAVCGLLFTVASLLLRQARQVLAALPAALSRLPALVQSILDRLDRFCAACPEGLREDLDAWIARLPRLADTAAERVSAAALRLMASGVAALPHLVLFCAATALGTFFCLSSYPAIAAFLRRQLTGAQRRRVREVRTHLFATAGKWLRAQAALLTLTFVQLLAGFLLLRQPYALLLAFLIALIDALPVLGTGTVLLPWAAFLLLLGRTPRALALTALYAVIALVRTAAEPRIVAAQAGLPPLAALMAMYAGFRAFGVGGMVLLPLALLLVKELHDAGCIRIWK